MLTESFIICTDNRLLVYISVKLPNKSIFHTTYGVIFLPFKINNLILQIVKNILCN